MSTDLVRSAYSVAIGSKAAVLWSIAGAPEPPKPPVRDSERMTTVANLDDVRARARRRLPRFVFDFIEGGAEDEVTLKANRRAFAALALRPHSIHDELMPTTTTTLFGERIQLPVLLAPTG